MAKSDLKKKPATQREILAALKGAGYQQSRFKILEGGSTLEIHLTPAKLLGADNNFKALEVCLAAGLQADCKVFPTMPHNVLILRVQLTTDHASTVTPHDSTPPEKEPAT